MTPAKKCMRCSTRVGWVGLLIDAALVWIKLLVGSQTGSRALMADALYSIIDVVSAVLVIASIRVSRRGVDKTHPYGRGKVEFLATACVSLCIAIFAILLLHTAVDDLIEGTHRPANALAAGTAVASMIACFFVWRYAHCVGTQLNSPIILTHAEHNKADAISSVAVLITIVLSALGLSVLDPIVAIAEIGHVLMVSFNLLRRGVDGLLDASVETEVSAVQAIVRRVPGVIGLGDVRVRQVGPGVWIEVAVKIGAHHRMSDAGRIRSLVRTAILSRIQHVTNIIVDVQPARPLSPTQVALPNREESS